MPYQLVQDNLSHDVVEALETMLHLAKKGEITGLAFVATMPKMRYITNVAGWCFKQPTAARGMVAFLGDQLAGLVHARAFDETR